jgi:osmotically-inducible protein OsmY
VHKTDSQIQKDIEAELAWDPKVQAVDIAVSVEKGIVWLRGMVSTYAEKWAAVAAGKRVSGVRTVLQDLAVKLRSEHKHSDAVVLAAVLNALKWDVFVPDSVTATIKNGAVTLEGEVSWNYQRAAAERALRHLRGVVSVVDGLSLKPHTSAAQLREMLQAALLRHATENANSIHIEESNGRVILTGHASSWQTIHDAGNTAWAAPGVTEVIDHVTLTTVL